MAAQTTSNIPMSSLPGWQRLREIIKEKSLLTDKAFTLASGQSSAYYFDMKPTTFNPEALNLLCPMLYHLVSGRRGVFVGGLAIGAIPIISALVHYSSTREGIMGFYVREEIKNHGTQNLIEGFLEHGADVIMLDDVTTTGGSVMKAVNAIRERDCKVLKVITIVDRCEGAAERFAREQIEFVALYTTRDFD